MATYYKVLLNGQSTHGGSLMWSLPTDDGAGVWTPGAWTPPVSDPHLCNRGYHLTTDPMRWPVVGMAVYEAEPGTIHNTDDDKIVTDRARLLRPAPEMIPDWWHAVEEFVAAIPAVPFFRPDGDPDPAWKLSTAPTLTAAWGAARGAARDAARDAAWGAAWGAAWDAARGAARDAARDAAWDAAWGAARGAARDAARVAVGIAAWATAGPTAGATAEDAALYARTLVCAGLPLAPEHRDHAIARWRVWQKGYCLLGDVDGVLWVYAATGETGQGGGG